jgi:hypothetical protein
MKKPCILTAVRLDALLAVAFHASGHAQVPANAYVWWEKRFGHLGKTTDENLGHADAEPAKTFAALQYRIREKRGLRGESGLSAVEKRLLVLARFDSAINGDEFKAYCKSETANETSAALDALKEIHATNAVAILERAMALFPDGKPASDLVQRRELVDQLGTRANFWINCNADYFIDNKTVYALIVAHARKMRTEIVLP